LRCWPSVRCFRAAAARPNASFSLFRERAASAALFAARIARARAWSHGVLQLTVGAGVPRYCVSPCNMGEGFLGDLPATRHLPGLASAGRRVLRTGIQQPGRNAAICSVEWCERIRRLQPLGAPALAGDPAFAIGATHLLILQEGDGFSRSEAPRGRIGSLLPHLPSSGTALGEELACRPAAASPCGLRLPIPLLWRHARPSCGRLAA
jgi:hypothetical protein